jgi:hypothetical protein
MTPAAWKKMYNNPEALAKWACSVLRSSGGTIYVNEYKYVACRRILRALGFAVKLGYVYRTKARPDYVPYTLTPKGWLSQTVSKQPRTPIP